MRVFALTGSTAAGKSTVAALFRQWGATVIDADEIVRGLQRPGQPVLGAMVAEFGTRIRQSDGTLDRATMRTVMLNDPNARARLETIVHPAVEQRRNELLSAARARGAEI